MNLPVSIFDTAAEAGAAVADRIIARLGRKGSGAHFLLGCPGGRSPKPVYAALAQKAAAGRIDLSRLIVVMMDEYVHVAANRRYLPPIEAHYSCRGFGQRDIVAVLNAGLPEPLRISAENLWMPTLDDPQDYDRKIAESGGIDYFILASGAGDGHIAFNPPGSAVDSRTRVVKLATQTRKDNLKTFPKFRDIGDVPSHGLTVGIGTIAEQSREVGMILLGADKAPAFQRITVAQAYDCRWPATIAAICEAGAVFADKPAAGQQ